jgi:hypothetical protein
MKFISPMRHGQADRQDEQQHAVGDAVKQNGQTLPTGRWSPSAGAGSLPVLQARLDAALPRVLARP